MKLVKYTLDRFEDDLAVLLLRNNESIQIDITRDRLPEGVKEGDILDVSIHENRSIEKIIVLKSETEEALNKASLLLEKLKNKSNKNS
ncbi:DUF3006 domain-containing protein [bacterium LRH843]|nr:DUF3006 domain-containing protein [bacterium LRH843]